MAGVRGRIIALEWQDTDWLVTVQPLRAGWDPVEIWWAWMRTKRRPKLGAIVSLSQAMLDA